jgi:DNA-binding NarL/FixJ family response regulator
MPAERQTIRILLIEDNPDDIFLFRATLSRVRHLDFEIIEADRIEQALALINENSLDIIVSDLNLPDSIGTDTVKRLVHHAGMVPIVALTGWEDPVLGAQLIEDGAYAYWSKDRITGSDLPNAIVQVVERSHSHG